jgi:hypothetical protein
MKIGIIGSRKRNTEEDLKNTTDAFHKLRKEYPDATIVSGGNTRGGDHFAEIIACLEKIPIKIFYADWEQYGRAAGFVRNTDIAKESDILIACIHESRTGGTEDTIKKFKIFHPEGKIILV